MGYPSQPLGLALDSLSSTRIAQNMQSSEGKNVAICGLFPIRDPPDQEDPERVVPDDEDPACSRHEPLRGLRERELLPELIKRVGDVVHRPFCELNLA